MGVWGRIQDRSCPTYCRGTSLWQWNSTLSRMRVVTMLLSDEKAISVSR